jgi:6-phosphogluconolactonase (cycloisomerase 2 family)
MQPVELISTPDERFLYVLHSGTPSVSVLAISGTDGQLSHVQDRVTGLAPSAIELAVRLQ